MKNIFSKKYFMSIVCLLFVAIIPLCSINIYNYSQAFSTTSQEETLDEEETLDDGEEAFDNTEEGIFDSEENNGASEEGTGNEEGTVDGGENISSDDEDEVTTTASGYWTDYGNHDFSLANCQVGNTNTYEIRTARQLATISWFSNFSPEDAFYDSPTFRLVANIDLSAHYWVPIMNFMGTFDGNGYTISGMTIDEEHDLRIDYNSRTNENIITVLDGETDFLASFEYPNKQTFGLFGHIARSCVISDVIVSGSITLNFELNYTTSKASYAIFVGGIVGGVFLYFLQSIHIYDCVSKVAIDIDIASNTDNVSPVITGACSGGIVGRVGPLWLLSSGEADRAIIERCINLESINVNLFGIYDLVGMHTKADSTTGGIIGSLLFGDINNCVNYGRVESNGKWTGGIIGGNITGNDGTPDNPDASISITYCINYGIVQGNLGDDIS